MAIYGARHQNGFVALEKFLGGPSSSK